jgi:hypothetical protein
LGFKIIKIHYITSQQGALMFNMFDYFDYKKQKEIWTNIYDKSVKYWNDFVEDFQSQFKKK